MKKWLIAIGVACGVILIGSVLALVVGSVMLTLEWMRYDFQFK